MRAEYLLLLIINIDGKTCCRKNHSNSYFARSAIILRVIRDFTISRGSPKMESNFDYANEDPLGFTKQTATMLVGLGAGDLIPQFRKRNISTQQLAALNKQDLMVLGADEDLADEMLKQLRAAAKKYGGRDLSDELRSKQLIKILKGANQQLNLLETFIAYARLRLSDNPVDYIIDKNKNIRASQALCSAADCIIADVEILEKHYKELAEQFSDGCSKTKSMSQRLFGLFAGLGLTTGLILSLKFAIQS